MADQLYIDLVEKMLSTETVKSAIPDAMREKLKALLTAEKLPAKEALSAVLDGDAQ